MRYFTFNGLDSRNYIDFIESIDRNWLPPMTVPSYKVPNRAGEVSLKRNEIDPQDFRIKIHLYALNNTDLRTKVRNLANFLVYSEDKQLIFSDEINRYYLARINTTATSLEEIAATGSGTLVFTAFDPFAYNISESTAAFGGAQEITVVNNGTAPTFPRIRMVAAEAIDYFKIINVTTGKFSHLQKPLAAWTELIMDSSENRVYQQSLFTNWIADLTLDSEFFPLEKGANRLRVENENADGTGVKNFCNIYWRERYF